MLRRVSPVFVLILLGASASYAQRQTQQSVVVTSNAPPWVVSVVHSIDSNKMIDRLRRQENVRVGVPGTAPQRLFNITTGLVVDGSGHVVARLTNLDPADKDEMILVTTGNGSQLRARLIGIDCPTGFAVLEVPALKVAAPGFAATSILSQGLFVKILSADVSARTTPQDNRPQLYVDYSIKQDTGHVGAGSMYAKVRGALTLTSSNLLSRNDGSIVVTRDDQVAGIAQYAGFGRAYLFPFEFIRDTVAKRVIQKQDSVATGWLGVKVDGLTQLSEPEFLKLGLAKRSGVIVREVVADSPAATSGIKANDVIVGLDEFDINSKTDLSAVLSSLPAGSNVKLRAIRNHDKLGLSATLGPARTYSGFTFSYIESESPDQSLAAQRDNLQRRLDELGTQFRANAKAAPSQAREEIHRELEVEIRQLLESIRAIDLETPPPPLLAANVGREGDPRLVFFETAGFAARDLDSEIEPQLAGFFGATKGVLLISVVKGSVAERAGLRAGDVIVGPYRRGLTCLQLERTLTTRRGTVSLKVLREKKPTQVSLDNRMK